MGSENIKGEFKILVADDEEHIRRILQFQLEKYGFEVRTAENGEIALEMVHRERPDLLILDLMMPKVDGFEVCRKLRSNFQTAQIPIIMLTAKSDLSDKIKGLSDGANDYLIKPYSNEELILRVRNVLEWSQKQKNANPLTGFAGNKAIEKELQRRIEAGESFAFLYIDIDNFKAYNDYYGYHKGDEAIVFAADTISEAVESLGGPDDFVGHIGGDDFIVLTSVGRAEFVSRHVIDEFDKGSLFLMDEEDIRRGYLEIRNRLGEIKRVPLMSLTVAIVINENQRLRHFAQVSDIASELKKFGKGMTGSVVVRERRRKTNPAEKIES
ncbi:MAG: response regulator [Candidatus Krumholzibacteriota bacterium]|nr:response regulator [Candidatus Krumholzibacteriota bacterium]